MITRFKVAQSRASNRQLFTVVFSAVAAALTPEVAASEGTMNAMALGGNGQLCCCAISSVVGPSLVGDCFLVRER
jgi:hypothetical protein